MHTNQQNLCLICLALHDYNSFTKTIYSLSELLQRRNHEISALISVYHKQVQRISCDEQVSSYHICCNTRVQKTSILSINPIVLQYLKNPNEYRISQKIHVLPN